MMINWKTGINCLTSGLKNLSVRDHLMNDVQPDLAFSRWLKLTRRILEDKKRVYFIGNGASASMASHIAADLAKNAHVRTEVFSDLSLITAIANDYGYEEVFAEPLRRRMESGDMLVAISSSGNSLNIIRAVETADEIQGKVVTLSAMAPSNRLRALGALNFYVPVMTYGMAESCHAFMLHYWMDCMEAAP